MMKNGGQCGSDLSAGARLESAARRVEVSAFETLQGTEVTEGWKGKERSSTGREERAQRLLGICCVVHGQY